MGALLECGIPARVSFLPHSGPARRMASIASPEAQASEITEAMRQAAQGQKHGLREGQPQPSHKL